MTRCSSCWPTTSFPSWSTVASRCVEVPFPPVPRADAGALADRIGRVPTDMAAVVADGAGGNPERARVMVDDPDVAARVALWTSVPDELTAAGMTRRRVDPTRPRVGRPGRRAPPDRPRPRDRGADRRGQGDGRARLPGRKEIVDQHQREERRFRTDALRAGLGVLARAYRRACGPGGPGAVRPSATRTCGSAAAAVGLITETAEALPREPERDPVGAVALRAPGRAGGVTPPRGDLRPASERESHARPARRITSCCSGCPIPDVARGVDECWRSRLRTCGSGHGSSSSPSSGSGSSSRSALGLSGLADGFHAEVASTVDAVGATSWVMSPSAPRAA